MRLRHKAHRIFFAFPGEEEAEDSSTGEAVAISSALLGENEVKVIDGLVADGIAIGSEVDAVVVAEVSLLITVLLGVAASLVSRDAIADSTELLGAGESAGVLIASRLLATGEIAGDILPLPFFF